MSVRPGALLRGDPHTSLEAPCSKFPFRPHRPHAEELPSLEEARALQAAEQEQLGHNPRGGLGAKVLVRAGSWGASYRQGGCRGLQGQPQAALAACQASCLWAAYRMPPLQSAATKADLAMKRAIQVPGAKQLRSAQQACKPQGLPIGALPQPGTRAVQDRGAGRGNTAAGQAYVRKFTSALHTRTPP